MKRDIFQAIADPIRRAILVLMATLVHDSKGNRGAL